MNFEHCNYTTISPQFRKIKLAATTGQRDQKTSVSAKMKFEILDVSSYSLLISSIWRINREYCRKSVSDIVENIDKMYGLSDDDHIK